MSVFIVGATLFVGIDVTMSWAGFLGLWKFLLLFCLLAPGAAVIGGLALIGLLYLLYRAQLD